MSKSLEEMTKELEPTIKQFQLAFKDALLYGVGWLKVLPDGSITHYPAEEVNRDDR